MIFYSFLKVESEIGLHTYSGTGKHNQPQTWPPKQPSPQTMPASNGVTEFKADASMTSNSVKSI